MLLIKDCLTLKTVSQKIPILLFKLAKLGHFNGCFRVSLSYPTGGQKLKITLSLITVRADY